MKKTLSLIVSLFVFSIASFAQKSDTAKIVLPRKDNKIVFEQIVDLPNSGKEIIYNNSLKWLATAFNDSKEVIQMKDKETGVIVAKGIFDFVPKGFLSDPYRMSFMVDISCKDNKSRLRLLEFQNETGGGDHYPIEDRYERYLNEKQWPKTDKKLYVAFKERVERIIIDYQDYMKKNIVRDDF